MNAPAFLVDQHRREIIADRGTQFVDQGTDLIRAFHVAGEQNETQGIGFGEKAFFRIAQAWAGATEDRGPGRACGAIRHLPGATTRQPCPRLDKVEQTARALAFSPAGPRRMR